MFHYSLGRIILSLAIFGGIGIQSVHAQTLLSPAPSSTYTLRVQPGAWQKANSSSIQKKGLHLPATQHTLSLTGTSEKLGVMRQAQTASPSFLGLPPPAFTLLIMEMTLVVGSIVVSIGSSIASQSGADMLGWKLAGIIIDGVACATAIAIVASMDLSNFPVAISTILYISLGVTALSFAWGLIQFILYVGRRKASKAKVIETNETPSKPAVHIAPWAGLDPSGNAAGGLAIAGRF